MLRSEEGEESVQTAHGRWINELQESLRIIKQDLALLEKRISVFEMEMAERSKTHRKIKSELSSLRAKLNKLSPETEKNPEG